MLAAKVFQLLTKLVSFGYYDSDDDVQPLIGRIVSCLSGSRDYLSQPEQLSSKRGRNAAAYVIFFFCFIRVYVYTM